MCMSEVNASCALGKQRQIVQIILVPRETSCAHPILRRFSEHEHVHKHVPRLHVLAYSYFHDRWPSRFEVLGVYVWQSPHGPGVIGAYW